MSELTFTVRFHEPFLVGSGQSGRGLDEIARAGRRVPAESLKGAMRAAAEQVIRVPVQLLHEVYGTVGSQRGAVGQGAWAWTDAGPDRAFVAYRRSRNRIDHKTRMVQPEALAFTEEIWQDPRIEVRFAIEALKHLEASTYERHALVLTASAYAVTALGHWRNRGMGAVTLRRVRDDGTHPAPMNPHEFAQALGAAL